MMFKISWLGLREGRREGKEGEKCRKGVDFLLGLDVR
jgi:hypothetical protein